MKSNVPKSKNTDKETRKKHKRLPKLQRVKDALPLALQERDELIIRAAIKFRFLRTNHIYHLVEGGEQGISRRLQKLFHAGYLDRVYDPDEIRRYRQACLGSPKAIYALANRGARLLAEKYAYPINKTQWDRQNRRITCQNIQHTLMITNFFITLYRAIQGDSGFYFLPVAETLRKLFSPEQDYSDSFSWAYMGYGLKSSVTIYDPRNYRGRATFYPDGFFAVQDSSREKGKNRAFFFIEADNHSAAVSRLRHKFLAHAAYAQNIKQGNNPLNLPVFRVLHISRTSTRVKNLWTFTRALAKKGVIPEKLHWFTSEEDYMLENPATLLDSIWQVAFAEKLQRIF